MSFFRSKQKRVKVEKYKFLYSQTDATVKLLPVAAFYSIKNFRKKKKKHI